MIPKARRQIKEMELPINFYDIVVHVSSTNHFLR